MTRGLTGLLVSVYLQERKENADGATGARGVLGLLLISGLERVEISLKIFLSFLFLQLILEKQKLLEMQLHLRLSEEQRSDSVCCFRSLFAGSQPEFNPNF